MEGPGWTVKEFSVPITFKIVLHVAVIWVIEDVEDSESDPSVLFFYGQADFAPDLQVGGDETGKQQFVSWPNEVAVLIDR